MFGFIDATCKKCGRRVGWQGDITDQPACPGCGTEPDREELARTKAKMEEAERFRATPHAFKPNPKAPRFCVCGFQQHMGNHTT